MTGYANGNSFGSSVASLSASVGNAIGGGEGVRWPVPPWKFGLRQSDDRGNI